MSTIALDTGLEVASRTDRLRGLDSLRFVAAMWVVFSHLGFAPVFAGIERSSAPGFLLNALMGVLFCGPAAVIVFFVISGFCIHYPYAGRQQFDAITFLIRRFVRIGIPMLAAILLTQVAGLSSADFSTAILWSLVAELAYYTLYPAIRKLMARFDINAIIVAAYALSLAVALTDPSAKGYGVFGWKLNWLLGLPCWLLGVRLAGLWASEAARAVGPEEPIGRWRIYVWALSACCLALNFHTVVGYPWTLNVFAVVAAAWIAREVARAQAGNPSWAFLEWAGRWSYSLYLCHVLMNIVYARLAQGHATPPILDWCGRIAFVLAGSYAFYLAVEIPSHRLARRLAGIRVSRLQGRPG